MTRIELSNPWVLSSKGPRWEGVVDAAILGMLDSLTKPRVFRSVFAGSGSMSSPAEPFGKPFGTDFGLGLVGAFATAGSGTDAVASYTSSRRFIATDGLR